ncbi:CfrBI family restriction endonuclease [Thermodesulfovibrio yellowstonii]|uniref:CfrBI family restriction endonuclease n=1 Tax=Thermodesulfovibrio yellowstonii TaxID=28262 RepID=UPI003C79DFAD
MKELIGKIVHSVLTGQDYRTYVLATINKRFLDKAQRLISEIFEYKRKGNNWLEKLLDDTYKKQGKNNKFKLLWFGGLNDKTVKNMTGGTSAKRVCLDLGKKNIKALQLLLEEFENSEDLYQMIINIEKDKEKISLDYIESLFFMNIISAMKLTIQGGAWSEVGKKTEKGLLFVIFKMINIPDERYILTKLTNEEMKKKGLVKNREIDAIVLNDKNEALTVELKLLGIGNPEIGDEAFSRNVNLFLTDKLTEMMKDEAKNQGITVIEFRQKNPLFKIYEFFSSNGVSCNKPEEMSAEELEKSINKIIREWREEQEDLKIVKKLKEWTK